MFEWKGSKTTWRTPRGEHGVLFRATFRLFVQDAVVVAPLWMNVHVSPPSIDL
jgi:hypothetical protein